MQKIATRLFMYASIVFGTLGLLLALTIPDNDNQTSSFHIVVMKLLMASGFVVLTSFALSVAGKYLNGKS
jgi:hypothetical protein